ncbi:MAG TPA: chemotaxis protein CheW [Archangium sp.]|nr:chemotaxis protein CheW [Archangium sp.]
MSPPPLLPVRLVELTPERSLVFESQGRLFGLPLSRVSQVVMRGPAFSTLPGRSGAVAGVMPHGQALWPLYSAPALLGGASRAEDFLVLAEVEGRSLGLCASRVLGVHPRFEPAGEPGEFTAPGVPGPVLFLDLQRMFS